MQASPFAVRPLDDACRSATLALLRRHLRSSLFLLGNLADHGPRATAHLNSANYHVIVRGDEVAAVFALTRRGNLLLQTDRGADYADAILATCDAEPFPLAGFLGDWDLLEPLVARHRARAPGWTQTYAQREPLFELPLEAPRPAPERPDAVARRLTTADYEAWRALSLAFFAEEGIPDQGTEAQRRQTYDERVAAGRQWGVAAGGALVSIAAVNVVTEGAALVGGVYTLPAARRRGYSRLAMERLATDARAHLGAERLVLFTGETNVAAQALYRGMGFAERGAFGMVFGGPGA